VLGVATNFFQASRRSQRDAELLYQAGRLGGADHLYGLAAECALKAILVGLGVITNPEDPRPYKKHIDELWPQFDAYMQGRSAQRYALPAGTPFAGWRVEHRYYDDATFGAADVALHQGGADAASRLLDAALLQGDVSP
jgi:hypothetical protein